MSSPAKTLNTARSGREHSLRFIAAHPGIRELDGPEAVRLRDHWRSGEQRDIAIDMMHLTLNVVAQTLFATDLREEVNELASAINRIMGPLTISL